MGARGKGAFGNPGHVRGTAARRRWLVSIVAVLLLLSGMGWLVPTEVAAGQNAWVDSSIGLRVRDGASSSATKIDVIDHGTQIWVTGDEVNGYVPMEYYGGWGWVAADYLSWDGNLSSSSAGGSGGERWIDINRSNGRVTLYEGEEALHTLWASLSRSTGEDYYATASGTYYVFAKNRELTYTEFAKNYITHWVGFDEYRRNGFHSYLKDSSGTVTPNGAGYTGGCVALAPGHVDILYDFAYVGMRVEIHW